MALFGKLFKKSSEPQEQPVETPAPKEPVVLKPAPFNLNDTLRDVANILAMEAQSKRISIVYRVGKNVPSQVIGDRYKLARVLNELIGNAIDFTDKRQDVVVQIRRNVKNEESVELHFEIIDRGVGIDPDAVETILSPMLSSDRPAASFGIEGNGLERARDIIHAMGGSIRMSCLPKEGCHVFFHVQLSAANLREKRHYRLPSRQGVGLKTLVIDDDIGSAKALVPMLEYFRHTVTVAEREALADAGDYDLVMMSSQFWDAKVPGFLDSLPKRPKFVLIESMLRHHGATKEALDFADWLIYKPFTQQFVYEMLAALYTDILKEDPEEAETAEEKPQKADGGAKEAPAEPKADGRNGISPRVDAFLNGGAIGQTGGEYEGSRCLCCKYSHQFFVAADGLEARKNDYGDFVEQLKEVIWKYVKSDKVVGGKIRKGEKEETAEYCKQMKIRLSDLGIYKLACLCDLLEGACREDRDRDVEALNNVFTYILTQTINSLDQFIDQAKYKIRG